MQIPDILYQHKDNKALLYELIAKYPELFLRKLNTTTQSHMAKELGITEPVLSTMIRMAKATATLYRDSGYLQSIGDTIEDVTYD